MMFCENPTIPHCNVDEMACTTEFNPVCTQDGTQYSNGCMATMQGVASDLLSGARCSSFTEAQLTPFQFAVSHDITSMETEEAFLGDNPVTREQAAKMYIQFAMVYLGEEELATRAQSENKCDLYDLPAVGPTLHDFVKNACIYGFFKGDNNYYMPFRNLSRAQALIVLQRISGRELDVTLFAGVDMNAAITRNELIMAMQMYYVAMLSGQ